MRYPVVKLLNWREREAELAASANPFAVVIQAATREAVDARSQAKIDLIRGLYARGYERAQVLELLRLIDWLVALPAERENRRGAQDAVRNELGADGAGARADRGLA